VEIANFRAKEKLYEEKRTSLKAVEDHVRDGQYTIQTYRLQFQDASGLIKEKIAKLMK
jgi:primosomal protein N'